MEELDLPGTDALGSLVMTNTTPDPTGAPFQVILRLRPGGHGTEDLVRDPGGGVLAWVLDPSHQHVHGERAPLVQTVPPEVAEAAERWLAGKT